MDVGQTLSSRPQSDAYVEGKKRLLSSQVGQMDPEKDDSGAKDRYYGEMLVEISSRMLG